MCDVVPTCTAMNKTSDDAANFAYKLTRAVDDANWNLIFEYDRDPDLLYYTDVVRNGGPLHPRDEATLPAEIRIVRAQYWPDLVYAGRFLIVTQAVHDILQELEPDAHQFFPLQVLDVTGTAPEQVFLLHCTTRIQPVITNRSDVKITPPKPPKIIRGKTITFTRRLSFTKELEPTFVLDKTVVADHHLWTGPLGGLTSLYFVSQAFKRKLEGLKLGVTFEPCDLVKAEPNDQL